MAEDRGPTSLDELLGRIADAAQDRDQVSMGAVLDVIGRRSFGPLLLLAGLITVAPVVGDVPGVPTIMGSFVLLVAIQIVVRREHVWLPDWLLKRAVSRGKVLKAVKLMRRPARWIDRWLRPRLEILVEGAASYVIAGVCILIAAMMPLMEIIPFSANVAGAALTAIGLALISRDGLLVLAAVAITIVGTGLAGYYLL